MLLKIMVDQLVNQGAVLAANQPLGEILPFVSREKVEGNPDKRLVIHISVLHNFYNAVRCYNRGKFVSLFMMLNICLNRIIHVL